MKMLLSLIIGLSLMIAGCGSHSDVSPSRGKKQMNEEESIGVATMKEDGTIVLRLRAKTSDGGLDEGYFEYPPDHKDYEKIKQHVGLLGLGRTVSVKPWPDVK